MSFMEVHEHLKKFKTFVDIRRNSYDVASVRTTGKPGLLIIRLKGIDTPEDALPLKGTELFVLRSRLPKLSENEFYIEDLKGLKVYTDMPKTQDALPAYTILAVHDFGAGTLLEIQAPDEATFMIPFTKDAVPHVDMTQGFVVANVAFIV